MNCWWCWLWAATDCSGVVWGLLLEALSAIPSIFWAALYLNSQELGWIRTHADRRKHLHIIYDTDLWVHGVVGTRGYAQGWSFISWTQVEGKWEAPFEKLPQNRIKGLRNLVTPKNQKRSRAGVGCRADSVSSADFWIYFLFGSCRNKFCSFCTSATIRSVRACRRQFQIPLHIEFLSLKWLRHNSKHSTI